MGSKPRLRETGESLDPANVLENKFGSLGMKCLRYHSNAFLKDNIIETMNVVDD